MKNKLVRNILHETAGFLKKFTEDEKNINAITRAGDIMAEAISGGGKIIACGNGGSMSDAMHFAAELTGRFHNSRQAISAVAISDPSHISCIGNDFGFEFIFSRYIEAMGKKGDVLLAISTSANSENIINAAMEARKNDLKIIGLTGNNGGRLANLCDLEIRAPKSEYSDRAQEIHIKVIHCLVDYIESLLLK